MLNPRYIDDCLERKIIFFTGKGGVGKTTLAWATALACQRRSKKRVSVASWSTGGESPPTNWSQRWSIGWHPLDTLSAFREYALRTIKFDTIYDVVFENRVFKAFVVAAPGLTDTVIAGKIWDLYDSKEQDLLIVDLPASGHAISFFKSPLGVGQIFAIGFVHRETEKICSMFRSPDVRLDLVALPEELPIVECRELKENLAALHPFPFGYLHLNQCLPSFGLDIEKPVTGLVEPFANVVENYRVRLAREKESAALALTVGLPMLTIPRFGSEALLDSIERTALELEKS